MRNVLVSVPVLLMLGAIVGVCEANNPMPIPDPNDDYMYGRGGGA